MKGSACLAVYWPGIDANISDYVKHFPISIYHETSQATQPVINRDIHDDPWEDIVANFFTFRKCKYFLIYDILSKYPFLFKAPMKKAEATKHRFQQVFIQYDP